MTGLALTSRRRERLERQLKEVKDARAYRRTLAILQYDEGIPVSRIAQAMGVRRQSVHRWINAYRANYDPEALCDERRPGRPRNWTKECDRRLARAVEGTPERFGYLSVNWTVPLLQKHFEEQTGKRFSEDTIRRALQKLGYVWKRPRYVLAPDSEREKKTADPQKTPAFAAS